MSKKTIITILAVAALAVGGYLLFNQQPSERSAGENEQLLADVDYLLDESIASEINDALDEMILSGFLDKEALAAESSDIDSLSGFEPPAEIGQYLNETTE